MTPQVQEMLDILQEECAEIIQAISKIRRFGIDEVQIKTGITNRQNLNEEAGDVMAMIQLLQGQGVVDADLSALIAAKHEKLKKWSTIYDQGV